MVLQAGREAGRGWERTGRLRGFVACYTTPPWFKIPQPDDRLAAADRPELQTIEEQRVISLAARASAHWRRRPRLAFKKTREYVERICFASCCVGYTKASVCLSGSSGLYKPPVTSANWLLQSKGSVGSCLGRQNKTNFTLGNFMGELHQPSVSR